MIWEYCTCDAIASWAGALPSPYQRPKLQLIIRSFTKSKLVHAALQRKVTAPLTGYQRNFPAGIPTRLVSLDTVYEIGVPWRDGPPRWSPPPPATTSSHPHLLLNSAAASSAPAARSPFLVSSTQPAFNSLLLNSVFSFVFDCQFFVSSGASVKPLLSRKLKGVYLGMTR